MSQIQAQVIQDSISPTGQRLTTFQLAYPRLVHSEFMTHRVFSRNASSSRAVPVEKMIAQVRTNPAMPVHWGKNQPGMQACEQVDNIDLAKRLWVESANRAADKAEGMMAMGLHKQVANRILEPYQIIHVVLTATEYDNFFELRAHEDADPNIQALAGAMLAARMQSVPVERASDVWSSENWHLPYISATERAMHALEPRYLAMLSAARCARVSYLTHDGQNPDPAKDLALYERLVGSRPIHASPVEHQAYPDQCDGSGAWLEREKHGNFTGWVQHRKLVELTVNHNQQREEIPIVPFFKKTVDSVIDDFNKTLADLEKVKTRESWLAWRQKRQRPQLPLKNPAWQRMKRVARRRSVIACGA